MIFVGKRNDSLSWHYTLNVLGFLITRLVINNIHAHFYYYYDLSSLNFFFMYNLARK